MSQGKNYWLKGRAGNDMTMTNVPNQRVDFRHRIHTEELSSLVKNAAEAHDPHGGF
jgi:hypothetical protein